MSSAGSTYDAIGKTYAQTRRTEPTWMRQISRALGPARSVVNVGAGTGSYEPTHLSVLAVEPSTAMLRQRSPKAARAIRARAEALPFHDQAFDAAMAILTIHHWSDPILGLTELQRVSKRQVVLTWDPALTASFWFTADYLPEVQQHERALATLDTTVNCLGPGCHVRPLPVPADCADGVLAAFWHRPHAYLDPQIREGMSSLALLSSAEMGHAVERLRQDLESGEWERRYGHLLDRTEMDLGYRLVVAD